VVTKKRLIRKILSIKDNLPHLNYVLVTDIDEHQSESVLSLKKLMTEASPTFDFPHNVDGELSAFLQYTSGSTGRPKGALHVHGGLKDMVQSFHDILEVKPGDIYWCTADFAWITGLVYGIIVPMFTATHQIQFGGTYNALSWLKILQSQQINVWYTAPTALRMLMQEDLAMIKAHNTSHLHRIYSVGEPLNPEIFVWGKQVFEREIYDTWFQSETGCIMIANHTGQPVKSRSATIQCKRCRMGSTGIYASPAAGDRCSAHTSGVTKLTLKNSKASITSPAIWHTRTRTATSGMSAARMM